MKEIHELSLEECRWWMRENNIKEFRANQLYEWLWKRNVRSFREMNNLPSNLKILLEKNFEIHAFSVAEIQKSSDGSIKYGLRLSDGELIEMVLIPSGHRITVCVSSQVGCPLNCSFCATAKLGFHRNLTAYEMYSQVFFAKEEAMRIYNHTLSNVVWMGMGEPLLNYEEVVKAIKKVVGKEGLEMSPSRITVSTSGICEGIINLARENLRINLAISLHTADPVQRSEIMPVNRKYPLLALSDALNFYHKKTSDRITIEYVLLKNLNDTQRHIDLLLKFCKRFPVKINVIEYNEHKNSSYEASDAVVFDKFVKSLTDKNLIVNIRRSKGRDIDAACGQLVNS